MRSKPTKVLPFDGLESENFEWMWSAIGEPPGSFPGVGTVDRVGVPPTSKTLPSADYKSSGRPEIVV